MKNKPLRSAQPGRRLVQTGFLLLLLFPLAVTIAQRLSYGGLPVLKSWALLWDPAVTLARLARAHPAITVIGAPLFLLVLSVLLGRFFCGWVCPIGTLADLVRPLAFWQKRHRFKRPGQNSKARYYLLAVIAGASLFSLKPLGIFDPLVIFQRASAALTVNAFAASLGGARALLVMVSLVFVGILAMELWRPRWWCRTLCPFGALLALFSRFTLLRRVVSQQHCNHCARCQAVCEMNSLSENGYINDYTQCTFCLKCADACPQGAITFSFAPPAPVRNLPATGDSTTARSLSPAPQITRREFLKIGTAALAGAAIAPVTGLTPSRAVLRPPGALPEEEFVRTCILCQECIRVCPTGGLRPAFLESGIAGIGTPLLSPRQGGCSLNPSCNNLCAQVCPVGAIRVVDKTEMKIGLAVVHREACLAWDQGAKCLVCVEACLNGAAIAYNGRVTVDPNRCTGCGRCESGCPVPGSAIRVVPRA